MIVRGMNTLYLYVVSDFPFFTMFKTIYTLVLFSLLAGVFASCASSTKEIGRITWSASSLPQGVFASCAFLVTEEEPVPVKAAPEPKIKKVAPTLYANPTSAFRMLKDDTALPTADQLSDGSETSLGYSQSGSGDTTQDDAPTTTVKPPKIEPEDQLAPSE